MVLLVTKNLVLAVALGVGFGVAQIGWLLARRKPIDTMQWLSIGLVVVAGAATLLTNDARFVMLKPTLIYAVVGGFMLRSSRRRSPGRWRWPSGALPARRRSSSFSSW